MANRPQSLNAVNASHNEYLAIRLRLNIHLQSPPCKIKLQQGVYCIHMVSDVRCRVHCGAPAPPPPGVTQ
jgi:hypothetical protein